MSNKKAYLKEMRVDVWLERNHSIETPAQQKPVVVSSESITPAPVEVKEAIESEIKHDVVNPVNPVNPVNIETLDWRALHSHVAECQLCDLSGSRTQTLFGSGSHTAPLMIIGGAPNLNDEQQGDVFSAEAGKLLSAMLKAMGFQRNQVYLSNIIKCKTPENQEPSEQQAASCESYLLRQISLLKPKLILALGTAAAQSLLKTKSNMNRLRGQLHYIDGIRSPILISYHPTYLLAAPNEKRKAWEDLQLAMKELAL